MKIMNANAVTFLIVQLLWMRHLQRKSYEVFFHRRFIAASDIKKATRSCCNHDHDGSEIEMKRRRSELQLPCGSEEDAHLLIFVQDTPDLDEFDMLTMVLLRWSYGAGAMELKLEQFDRMAILRGRIMLTRLIFETKVEREINYVHCLSLSSSRKFIT